MSLMFNALVIEDNPNTLDTLRNALTRLGCVVTAATTAENGIEELQRSKFDAVFAELCIREQGGRGIARWVKSQCLNTRFFIVTSWKGELEPKLLLMEGIHGIIRKPLIFNEIRDKVLEHLG